LVFTYAYVNPVVAVLLGYLLASESLTIHILIAATIVVGSVALTTVSQQASSKRTQK
jgi:drug/metabolite transporter (DMT)-like permease